MAALVVVKGKKPETGLDVWWRRLLLLRQKEDKRGTDDDVRLRMRHTAVGSYGGRLLAHWVCCFAFCRPCCVWVWRAGVCCTRSNKEPRRLRYNTVLGLQHGACQTWSFLNMEPFHPTTPHLQWPTCFFCHDNNVDGTASAGRPQIELKVHRSIAPRIQWPASNITRKLVWHHRIVTCPVSPPRQSQNPRFCLQRPESRRLHWTTSCVPRAVLIDCLAGTWTVPCREARPCCACSTSSAVTRDDQSPLEVWVSEAASSAQTSTVGSHFAFLAGWHPRAMLQQR